MYQHVKVPSAGEKIKVNADFSLQVRSKDVQALRKSINRSSWVVFWGLILAAATLGLILKY